MLLLLAAVQCVLLAKDGPRGSGGSLAETPPRATYSGQNQCPLYLGRPPRPRHPRAEAALRSCQLSIPTPLHGAVLFPVRFPQSDHELGASPVPRPPSSPFRLSSLPLHSAPPTRLPVRQRVCLSAPQHSPAMPGRPHSLSNLTRCLQEVVCGPAPCKEAEKCPGLAT